MIGLLKKYLRFSNIVKLCLGIYFVLALISGFAGAGPRILFNETWFTKTPVIIKDYGLFVTSINGVELSQPNYIELLPELTSNSWYFQVYGQIQKIGGLAETQQYSQLPELIQQLKRILSVQNMNFELHKREFNSIDYVQKKIVENHVTLPIEK